jgi:hypothetical protein
MIYVFICPTVDCENHINPVFLEDPTNPVLCSLCHAYGDAVPYVEPTPEPKATKKS